MIQFYRISGGISANGCGTAAGGYIMGAGMNRDVQTEETVKRLVAFFAPERVYLFGSTAISIF
jgi:hypothetical protein